MSGILRSKREALSFWVLGTIVVGTRTLTNSLYFSTTANNNNNNNNNNNFNRNTSTTKFKTTTTKNSNLLPTASKRS